MGILDSIFGGGSSTSKKKTKSTASSVQKTEAPAYIQQASQQAVQQASDAAAKPYEAYTGDRVAGLSDSQTGAMDIIRGLTAKPAGTVLDDVGGHSTQDYLNPYLSDMMAMVMGNIDEGTNLALKRQGLAANGASAYGDARHGVLDTGIVRENLRARREAGTDIGFKAFNEALRLKGLDLDRLLQGDRDMLEKARALFNDGGVQQQTAQKGADAAYEAYLREQGYPMEQAKQLAAIAAAAPYDKTVTGNSNSTEVVKTTTPTPSVASQVLGTGATLAGAYLGGPGGAQLTSSIFGGGGGGAVPATDSNYNYKI